MVANKEWLDCFWKDDELMVRPALVGMTNIEATLCLGYDGEPMVYIGGDDLFIPSSWAERERPSFAEALQKLREIAKKHK